jgi:hypothetical protein
VALLCFLFLCFFLRRDRRWAKAFSFSSIHYAGHNSFCFISSSLHVPSLFLVSLLDTIYPMYLIFRLICLCYAPRSRTQTRIQ